MKIVTDSIGIVMEELQQVSTTSGAKKTRSVHSSGKYCSIRHIKISEIQTGFFGRMEIKYRQAYHLLH